METDETHFLAKSLLTPVAELRTSFKVTRKGCGRGSGEAPRALKLMLLNRLVAAHPNSAISHEGGDSYRLSTPERSVAFTFRITTAKRLSETGRPWFNVSARELASWAAANRQLIIAECKSVESLMVVRTYVVNPADFNDITQHATKLSETVPSALFEVQQDETGFFLFNLTARTAYPVIRIRDEAANELPLTAAEEKLLEAAYSDIRERDRTVGGDFEPLVFTVDPGTAPANEIAAYLSEVSHFYHLLGGSGVQFAMVDSRSPAGVSVA